MISEATLAWLRLSLVHRLGPHTARQLIAAFGSVEEVWRQSPKGLRQVEGVGAVLVQALLDSKVEVASAMAQTCQQHDIQLISPDDPLYPPRLNQVDDAPLLLYAKGHVRSLIQDRMLAVVGARRASREGQLIARRWSRYLAERHCTIVSGMAYGIDAAAHGGTLEASSSTIAVLGCGLMTVDARQQRQIDAIGQKGCVISEYCPEVKARPEHFPRRNRIIAGLAEATLVVEADIKSGSLITAGQAAQYGREVLAVPGSVLHETHAGCHQLIRDGATLCESADALLRDLGWDDAEEKVRTHYTPSDEQEAKVIEALKMDSLNLDALAICCCLTVPTLSPILLRLELQGMVERLPGSRYTLV
ncbi:MAG: DNA-processing protein DprA [Mariprofundaceae bacterium]